MSSSRPGRRSTRALRWAERLFLLSGAAALAWCLFVVGQAYIVQRLAREQLGPMPAGQHASIAAPAPPRGSPIAAGTPLAELSIPRIALSAIVLHGSDERTLRLGLGHIENTALPGEPGNVAIAGHRDSFFRPLRDIRVGDDILLDTPEERVRYRVSSFRVVSSYEVSVIRPTKDDVLTLVTCYPFWFIGQAPDRFVVRAARVGDTAAAPRAPGSDGAQAGPTAPPSASVDRPPARSDRAAPSGVPAVREASDDDTLVREAVARFQLAYNAHLAKFGSAASDERLTFHACEVAPMGETAAATCDAGSSEPAATVWTFSFERVGGNWSIRSVGTK